MVTVRGDVDRHRRVIVDVAIQPTPLIVGDLQPTIMPIPSALTPLKGLVDTGATRTCITRKIVKDIGLRPRGKISVQGVSGVERHNLYSFELAILYDDRQRGMFWIDGVSGADFYDNADFDVLIGMDVIMRGDLRIGRDGQFSWQLT